MGIKEFFDLEFIGKMEYKLVTVQNISEMKNQTMQTCLQ